MMAPDKKKDQASMIIASMRPEAEMPMDSEMPEDGQDVAAQELMSAIESKDPMALKEAMKSFVQMCMDNYSSEPAEEQE